MRIALRAVASPTVQRAEATSQTVGTLDGDSPITPEADGAPTILRMPTARQANGHGANAEGDKDGRVWRVDVPGVTSAVPLLRRWVRLLLADEAELSEAFELVVSEYGTNALLHTASSRPGGRIRAELSISNRWTRLTVMDDGPAAARTDRSVDPAEHGRGLILADAYADETGQYDCADGHAAWALITR
ncbi:ATP-binding protein [Actinomadura mexicana]|uniref:Anti-sigma regulatory factor (Ser/Thr protein kinase) n=1 Tax=Actinomadura mexicana TaxID=134959 RepID=A0A238VWG8_9ACTN|nr:ATP-binding protein [Actinomadura mexicana]SNR38474.1 Anti-sigma regulatory factor (Ser/Thr protein kinase) [Actinomadura mexicana]